MDKALNRFARLRYKDGATVTDKEEISARKLSKEIGLSAAKISDLEKEALKDCCGDTPGDVPSCRASSLKLYHDYFGCSYEYLMGETAHKTPEYYNMGKDHVLGLFDDSFIDNLKELLEDGEYQDFNVYMLHVFMSDPKQLQYFMETAFRYLYEISVFKRCNDIKKPDKERLAAPYWFALYTLIREYFETLMPKLGNGFRQHEQRKADERAAFEEDIAADAERSAVLKQEFTDSREESQE